MKLKYHVENYVEFINWIDEQGTNAISHVDFAEAFPEVFNTVGAAASVLTRIKNAVTGEAGVQEERNHRIYARINEALEICGIEHAASIAFRNTRDESDEPDISKRKEHKLDSVTYIDMRSDTRKLLDRIYKRVGATYKRDVSDAFGITLATVDGDEKYRIVKTVPDNSRIERMKHKGHKSLRVHYNGGYVVNGYDFDNGVDVVRTIAKCDELNQMYKTC